MDKTDQTLVSNKFSGQPQEWLLEVVVGFGGDVVVLKVLLAVESDGLGLYLTFLDIDLVSTEDNWDILTDTDKVTLSCFLELA